ncbi:MAG: hypothetical protein V7K35_01720 [Nostoc sp.]|uniref:hypothetical protein n=1 Tax=Nostoc sp. TaxID=1180 RepID=UPI002FFC51BD
MAFAQRVADKPLVEKASPAKDHRAIASSSFVSQSVYGSLINNQVTEINQL